MKRDKNNSRFSFHFRNESVTVGKALMFIFTSSQVNWMTLLDSFNIHCACYLLRGQDLDPQERCHTLILSMYSRRLGLGLGQL